MSDNSTDTIQKQDIFSFVISEENAMVMPITVIDNYEWNFKDHVRITTLYKSGKFDTGNNREGKRNTSTFRSPEDKPFKNITRPILNLQHHAVDFDVKDIELFINSSKQYYKSFLVRKFHDKWARENKLDTFIDELVESFTDFGGALIKKTQNAVPEVVQLASIAFIDQTDLLGGTIGIKHFFSPTLLRDMASVGWGNTEKSATISIEDAIMRSSNSKRQDKLQGNNSRTPNKYIEVYEVHGTLPLSFLTDKEEDQGKYVPQLSIVVFTTTKEGTQKGEYLFRGEEKNFPFKAVLRDPIFGRALGMGGGEELFEPQVWTNYGQIRVREMLDAASKIILKTTDKTFANKNKISNMENLEIAILKENTDISQIDTFPRNINAFEKSINDWETHAQQMGGAQDALLGKNPPSGSPFKLQELVVQQGSSLHKHRRGILATFMDELYQDWIIPHLAREITKGDEFLAELDLDELQEVADNLIEIKANKKIKEKILNGETIDQVEIDTFKVEERERFMKGGNKRFIKILKDEMKDAPMSIKVNIEGKQKDVELFTDKLVNIFRQIFANPAMLDDPRMVKILNEILENSGISPIDFIPKTQVLTEKTPQGTSGVLDEIASEPIGV